MLDVGIRELRASLATQVARAAAGDTIRVRVNGTAVAALGPLVRDGAATLADLVATGALVAPRRADATPAATAVRVWRNARLDRLAREIRG